MPITNFLVNAASSSVLDYDIHLKICFTQKKRELFIQQLAMNAGRQASYEALAMSENSRQEENVHFNKSVLPCEQFLIISASARVFLRSQEKYKAPSNGSWQEVRKGCSTDDEAKAPANLCLTCPKSSYRQGKRAFYSANRECNRRRRRRRGQRRLKKVNLHFTSGSRNTQKSFVFHGQNYLETEYGTQR